MNLKRTLALALALCMILALAACGNGGEGGTGASNPPASQPAQNESQAPGGETSGEPVAITLWTYPIGSWGGQNPTVDDMIANFNAVYPDITVNVQYLDYTNGDDRVMSAINGGTTPDIIMEGPERLVSNWGAAGKMVDLSDLWTKPPPPTSPL